MQHNKIRKYYMQVLSLQCAKTHLYEPINSKLSANPECSDMKYTYTSICRFVMRYTNHLYSACKKNSASDNRSVDDFDSTEIRLGKSAKFVN